MSPKLAMKHKTKQISVYLPLSKFAEQTLVTSQAQRYRVEAGFRCGNPILRIQRECRRSGDVEWMIKGGFEFGLPHARKIAMMILEVGNASGDDLGEIK